MQPKVTMTWPKKRAALVGAATLLFGTVATALLNEVSAVAAAEGIRQGNITTASVRVAETEAGNVVADAVRAAGGADIGFIPAAAFKPGASVPRPASGEQAASLVEPPSDVIVVLSLRGDQIMAALERSVSFAPQPSAGFLQVSGLRFTFDPKRDGGKRITATSVNGTALEASKTYKVATTRPLANGQQGYFQIWDKDAITSDTGKSLAAALNDLAKARGGSLTSPTEGRIKEAGS
jgi:2',3'-cyclic-nucleotide 2'-phosphodiesterase (5'-nucleotidase family)